MKFENNTAEFGEGALYYKGTGSRILGNYFAFNSFEQRTAYTLNNMAQRSVVAHNTLLSVWKSKFYGAFVLNHRVVLHAVEAAPARWRGGAGLSPLDRLHPAHWLIFTQVAI